MANSSVYNRGSWREIRSFETSCRATDFLSGVEVWIKRPQVVNRRLLGAVLVEGDWNALPQLCDSAGDRTHALFIRELLPRVKTVSTRREAVTVTCDEEGVCVTFDPLTSEATEKKTYTASAYQLRLQQNRISLMVPEIEVKPLLPNGVVTPKPLSIDEVITPTPHLPDGVVTPTLDWLNLVLLPKIVQWTEESGRGLVGQERHHESLVPLDRYSVLYGEMREKYGPPLIKNWPEATDPHKFVYEDIAIATYLIVLWEEEQRQVELSEKQSFIDLGCGNGLLVYLLSCEGYKGKGIDLRRRKIWSYYGNKADLEVSSLTPSDLTVFPQFDWLIGNHSDELTPWIPLMAARSSYRTRYFVLPCCPHDFDSKFRRPNTSISQYSSYLAYIKQIGETVGFKVHQDTLRIPSSKRVCQVGRERWYPVTAEEEMEEKRRSLLRERCRRNGRSSEGVVGVVRNRDSEGGRVMGDVAGVSESGGDYGEGKKRSDGEVWSDSFVPRSETDQSRNCLRVDRDLQQFIVSTLTAHLLLTENWISISPTLTSSSFATTSTTTTVYSSTTSSTTHLVPTEQEYLDMKPNETPRELPSSDTTSQLSHSNSQNNQIPGTNEEDLFQDITTADDDVMWENDDRAADERSDVVGKMRRVGKEKEECAANRGKNEATGSCQVSEGKPSLWNLGGRLHISEAVKLFDGNVLKELRHECGGLQTLLRNHHQIFQVNGGYVQLRNWSLTGSEHGPRRPAKQRSAKDAKRLVKTKPCWFYHHHPQGCPRWSSVAMPTAGISCPYAHDSSELRKRPDFSSDPESVVPFV